MNESYERYPAPYKEDSQYAQRASARGSGIHPDCIPVHKAEGKTPQFAPFSSPAKP